MAEAAVLGASSVPSRPNLKSAGVDGLLFRVWGFVVNATICRTMSRSQKRPYWVHVLSSSSSSLELSDTKVYEP